MATTLEQVREYLNDLGVEIVAIDAEREQIMFYLYPLNLALRCYINLSTDGKYLAFTCYPDITGKQPLDPARREQVLERLNEFNHRWAYGRWALDQDDDPQVNFQLHLEDALLTRRQLWRVIFILKDLVILQAQCLQLLIVAGIDEPVSEVLLSGTALNAASRHPSRVADIARALHLAPSASRMLHELVGETFVEPEEGREAFEAAEPALLLN